MADQFHLVHNVSRALKDFLYSRRWNVPEFTIEGQSYRKRLSLHRKLRGLEEVIDSTTAT